MPSKERQASDHELNRRVLPPAGPQEPTSDVSPLAGPPVVTTTADDFVVALMSYNVGINNNEIGKSKWDSPGGKFVRLQNDVENAFDLERGIGIQILLISEFGNMEKKVTNSDDIITGIVKTLDLSNIHVEAMPPYIALIDRTCWTVQQCEILNTLCDKGDFEVQHLLVRHVDTGKLLRCFNAHIPTRFGSIARKNNGAKHVCHGNGCQCDTLDHSR